MIEQAGAPLDLYHDPVNVFVAGFLGTPAINLMKAKVKMDGSKVLAILDNGAAFELDASYDVSDGQEVIYGVRPEHLALSTEESTEGIAAMIDSIENTGSDMVIFCSVGSVKMTVAFKEQRDLSVGQAITIVPNPAMTLLFDAQTEQRLRPSGKA